MYRELRDAVEMQLVTVDKFVRDASGEPVVTVAKSEVPHLVDAVRAVLSDHQPDARGRCATCRSRWWFVRRRPNMPCKVYLAVRIALSAVTDSSTA